MPLENTILVQNFENFEFQKDDIFLICDTIDYNLLDLVFSKSIVPKFVVGTNATSIEYRNKVYTTTVNLPSLDLRHCVFLSDKEIKTNQCFNFLINKKKINRYLLIKLVEYFKLTKLNYTWSGIGRQFDLTEIINEWNSVDPLHTHFNDNLRNCVLSPILLDKFFLHFQNIDSNNDSNVVNYGTNTWTWNNIFKESMTETAVSLISESVGFEKSSVFTEKTVYSILALTFPIFIGGYGHAEQFKKMGYDNFDDIVDHSYQYKETLFERCYYAFLYNYKLLEDLDYVCKIRSKNLDRLKNNRELCVNGQFTKFVNQEINSWPDELKNSILPYMELFS
jgi:hypothetical protein